MNTISEEVKEKYHVGTVVLRSASSGSDTQYDCKDGYEVELRRKDGKPLSEMEIRSVIVNLSWAVDGEDSLINLVRDEL